MAHGAGVLCFAVGPDATLGYRVAADQEAEVAEELHGGWGSRGSSGRAVEGLAVEGLAVEGLAVEACPRC